MKKLSALLVLCSLGMFTVGCGPDKPKPNPTPTGTSTTTAADTSTTAGTMTPTKDSSAPTVPPMK